MPRERNNLGLMAILAATHFHIAATVNIIHVSQNEIRFNNFYISHSVNGEIPHLIYVCVCIIHRRNKRLRFLVG